MQFNISKTKGTSTSMARLRGNEIHDVLFKGVTCVTYKNKKDESNPYKVMKIRFENEEGYFEESVFAPKEGDDVRGTITVNGVERETPAALERFQFLVAHIVENLGAQHAEKFKAVTWDLPKDFEKMVEKLGQATAKSVDKPIKLKLVLNKKGEPSLPFFVNLSNEGEAYLSNNFLGDKTFFSDYELKKMEEAKKSAPTDMSKVDTKDEFGDAKSDDQDIDFDI